MGADDFDWGAWLDQQAGGAPPTNTSDANIDSDLANWNNQNYWAGDEYDKGFGGANQEGPDAIPAEGKELYPGWTGTGLTGAINALRRLGGTSGAKNFLNKGLDLATSKGGMAGLMALLAMLDKRKPTPAYGGGSTQGYAGPAQINREIVQGKYGPIAQYKPPVRAATGGTLYAQGGPVQMEHGGFVMTEKAVNGAGGPQGIRQLVPGAQMIRGPGTGTSDSIKGVINGPRGQTPALVSNGEAYVPKQSVQDAGGSRELYALMNQLQRRG